jgi:hypothetical protein
MPAPSSLLLEVYQVGGEVVDWSVSSDVNHIRPYLIGQQNYAAQQLDPISAAATIGTLEIGVIDPAQTAGDQDSGWMTERVSQVRGRRCRLRRYIDEVVGWVTLADGPAGTVRLDSSYSAYRFPIRDTREIERKIAAFNSGGVTGLAPLGPIYGFGLKDDDTYLVDPVTPFTAPYGVNEGSQFGIRIGFVTIPWTGTTPPANAVVSKDAEAALHTRGDGLRSVTPYADVLWRVAGSDDPWNVARPSFPSPYTGGQRPLAEVEDGVLGGDDVRAIKRIFLWAKPIGEASDGTEPFNADPVDGVGDDLEVIIRWRAAPTDEFPFYYEGTAGGLLADLYDGVLSGLDPISSAARERGALYDPAGLEAIAVMLAGGVKYDADALEAITTPVLLRQTESVDDGRSWAEQKVYGPSGWIPALDGEGKISPVSRARPSVVEGPLITGTIVEPSPDWHTGEQIVTRIDFSYPRYFIGVRVEVKADGLSIQPVIERYIDADAESTEGQVPQTYDASAFGAIGDETGQALPGGTETAALLAQEGRYELIGRYRRGAEAFYVRALRSAVPFVRVGDWCPAALSWLPNTTTNRRGLDLPAVQVLSIDDSESAWRYFLLEASAVVAAPGYFHDLSLESDGAESGFFEGLEIIEDSEES